MTTAAVEMADGGGGLVAVLRRLLVAAAVLAAAWAIAVSLPEIAAAVASLRDADRAALAAALACQTAALAVLPQTYRRCIAALGGRVGYRQALAVSLRAFAVGRILPGGGAAAALYAARRFTGAGIAGPGAVAAVALCGVTTMLTLAAVAALASVGPATLPPLAAAAVVTVVVVLLGALAMALGSAALRWRITAFAARMLAGRGLRSWADAVDALGRQRADVHQLFAAVGWSALNWTLELAALWWAFTAVGRPVAVPVAAAAFGAANAVTALPHTPGGVGLVETGMAAAFTALGVPTATAVAGVLGYRAVSFWLPVAVGGTLLATDALRSGATR